MGQRIVFAVVIFLAGAVTSMNLSYIVYGFPSHYEGGWGKFIFAIVFAILAGMLLVKPDKPNRI